MENGRLIYTICRKLFYTICHLCITNVHYHRRQAWTRLNNIRIRITVTPFHTPVNWYLDKRKQLHFVYHLSRVSSATYHQNCRYNGSTTFKLISYKISISEIQDQQVVPRYSHTTRLSCGQAIHNHIHISCVTYPL